MAAPTTADEFIDLVIKSGVVDESRVRTYVSKLKSSESLPAAPTQTAGLMVRDGILTYFQAEQILQGKWRRFNIGKYKVLERLGSGGMGQVFLCEHKLMHTRVAVKVLPTNRAEDSSALHRFYREAKASAALDHPNIVRAYDIDQDEQIHFLVMDYVDGASLQEIIKKSGTMEANRACHYIREAATGLQYAFECGIVHRDIKPANILVSRDGAVKILDMGLARFFNDEDDAITKKFEESVLGTADYLAPEQVVDSHTADIRADIYCLGGTFYFLLAGRPPFGNGSVAEKLFWHQNKEPDAIETLRPDVPAELAAVLRKMMAKDKEKRFQTPGEVADALKPFIRQAVGAPPAREMPALSLAASGGGPTQSSILRGARKPVAKISKGPNDSSGISIQSDGPAVAVHEAPPPGGGLADWQLISQHDTGPLARQETDRTPRADIMPVPTQGAAPDNPFQAGEEKKTSLGMLPIAAVVLLLAAGAFATWYFAIRKEPSTGSSKQTVTMGPARLYVSKAGKDADTFATLKAALEAAKSGDRIILRDSPWDEIITLARPPKNISIEGELGRPVEWSASGKTGGAGAVLTCSNATGLTLRNIILKMQPDNGPAWEYGISVAGGCPGLNLENIEFLGARNAGLLLTDAKGDRDSPIRIVKCKFVGSPESAAGIRIEGRDAGQVTRDVQIRECRFEGPLKQALQMNGNVADVLFTNNRIHKSDVGILFEDWNAPQIQFKAENNTMHTGKAFVRFANFDAYLPKPVAELTRIDVFRNLMHSLETTLVQKEKENRTVPGLRAAENFENNVKASGPGLQAAQANFSLLTDPKDDRTFLRYPRGSELMKKAEGQKPVGAVPQEINLGGK